MTADAGNRRILIVDDTEGVHDDFRKILGPAAEDTLELELSEASLFGDTAPARQDYELNFAYQGEAALAMVVSALARGKPYALAFIDMRMPPGWDGAETIERIWQVDPKLQIALCTAYSNYSLEELAGRLDLKDRFLILKKPIDNVEVRQMASALTTKWQMREDVASKMECLEQEVEERTRQLSDANIIMQNSHGTDHLRKTLQAYLIQLSAQLRTDHAETRKELKSLSENIGYIKEIVALQQGHEITSNTKEALSLPIKPMETAS